MSDIKLKAASGGGSISLKGPSSLDTDRDLVDTSGNINLLNSQKLKLGTDNDLQIYHDGSNSFIDEAGTGDLLITATAGSIQLKKNTGEKMIQANVDGAVELYHDDTLQCSTSANGLAFPSGKGIDFSATSDAGGMTSELLDEYEEGTWTPTSNTGSVTVVTAHYVRIGSQVTAQAYINFPSMSGSAGVTIAGFPFATTGTNDYYTCAVNSDANAGSQIQGQFATSTLRLVAPNNGGFSVTTMSSKFIIFSITYAIH